MGSEAQSTRARCGCELDSSLKHPQNGIKIERKRVKKSGAEKRKKKVRSRLDKQGRVGIKQRWRYGRLRKHDLALQRILRRWVVWYDGRRRRGCKRHTSVQPVVVENRRDMLHLGRECCQTLDKAGFNLHPLHSDEGDERTGKEEKENKNK